MISTHIFKEIPDIPIAEVFRYAGFGKEEVSDYKKKGIEECIRILRKESAPKACYKKTSVSISGNTVLFDDFSIESKDLSKNLKKSKEAFLFSSTLGLGVDMLINRYSKISPIKALYFQAIGTAAIESVCDMLCRDILKNSIQEKAALITRFSPGYGDLCIEYQKDFFKALDCQKKIGLYLTDGGFMVPSKSVTAIVGIVSESEEEKEKICGCSNIKCEFRR